MEPHRERGPEVSLPRVAIAAALRTPIGRYGGALAGVAATQLGAEILRAALTQTGIPTSRVDLVVAGLARQAGCGPNPARQMAIGGGLGPEVVAYTLNQACASGLAAVAAAARHIRAGEANVVVSVGAENMSRVPYLLDEVRFGQKMGHRKLIDAMYQDGLFCPLAGMMMGETVEALARELKIEREQQDEYALTSQRRYQLAREAGHLDSQIHPLAQLRADEHPRANCQMESLSRLAPVFDRSGTITAGNSSGITDGAAALVLLSEAAVRQYGVEPLAWFEHCVTVGLAPERMGLGPVEAIQAYEQRCGVHLDDFDLIELNEAFAAQVLACDRQRPLPRERLNVNGGAIAVGHPIGCSGARVAVTLLHEMRRREARSGLATLCVSGGLGICAGFSRPQEN